MPHPESEHGLRVQLATALRERDEARERARVAEAAWAKAKFRALPEYAQDTMDAVLARADVTESQVHASEMRRDAAESALAAANARADDSARKLAAMEKYHEFAVTQSQEALAAANARADAAEAKLATALQCGDVLIVTGFDEEAYENHEETIKEALAAARRECAEQCDAKDAAYEVIYRTRDLLDECDDVLARVQGHGCPPSDESVSTLRKKIRTALAAPAAASGEEKP